MLGLYKEQQQRTCIKLHPKRYVQQDSISTTCHRSFTTELTCFKGVRNILIIKC